MSAKFFEAERFDGDRHSPKDEWVVEEGPLQIRVNGKPFTVTLRTPGADRQLVMGLLFAEGLVENPSDILSLEEKPSLDETTLWSATLVKDIAPEKLPARSLASTSSCGLCGKTEWESSAVDGDASQCVPTEGQLSLSLLDRCFRELGAHQELFARTGGCHAAAVFSLDGTLLAFGEDAGRHNAVDKAIGDLWSRGKLGDAKLMCVSGRVAYEIATKAKRAGFEIIAAVSAPSSMAVDYCRENGITLLGFCRGDRATAYSHSERLIAAEAITVQ